MPDELQDKEIERRLEAWVALNVALKVASKPGFPPSPALEQKIHGMLASSLTPVNPLPAQSRLAMAFLAVFAACAAALAAMLNKAGFHLMTAAQMGWMAAIFAAGAILFSLTLASRMVPGSRERFPFWLALALSCLGVVGGMTLLFPWRMPHTFISEGWPCASLELMIAIPGAVIFWLLARRGELFPNAGLGAAIAGLAVFLALLALQFQCMFQQAPHLLVWHGAVAAVLIGLGALIGRHTRVS